MKSKKEQQYHFLSVKREESADAARAIPQVGERGTIKKRGEKVKDKNAKTTRDRKSQSP